MANLLDIRRRIKSVKNTEQVTKAMKMVSAAKLRRAQERVINARPFAAKMREMLENLASQTSEDFHHPLLDARGDQRYRVFLITADKGLCGGFNANLIKATQVFLKQHADKETLRKEWMTSDDRWAARAGWQLTAGRVAKSPEGLDLDALLDRIEKEMGAAAPEVQWTMNMCLAEIGIHFPKHRKRALAIGEKLGIYRDYPCSKGCTSPFAPIWINEMVKRQG